MQDKSRCRLSNTNVNKLSKISYGIKKEFNYSLSSNRKVGDNMERKAEKQKCESRNSRNSSRKNNSSSRSNSSRSNSSKQTSSRRSSNENSKSNR